MVPHFVRFRPVSTTAVPVPPVLATLIGLEPTLLSPGAISDWVTAALHAARLIQRPEALVRARAA
jgi:hypothetical protein